MIKLIKGQKVSDGAGVKLNRVIGTQNLDHADPFYLLDEFRSDDKNDYIAGFPMHPHRGIETITYMIEGSFTHRDSKGNSGTLKSGEVQWMTAGRGILHEEMPAMEEGHLWGYQLWVNLPAKEKMIPPAYRHVKSEEIPRVKKDGVEVRLIAGEYAGIEGPIESNYPVEYMDVRISGGVFEKGLKGTNLIYVHTNKITVSIVGTEMEVTSGNLCLLEEETRVKITGDNGGFLFISSNPIKEPVARYGPFVMNTMDEIIQAMDDYNSGVLDK